MKLAGMRVLVVEDEGMIAMLAKGMLASMGCEVVGVAGRMADALSKIDALRFDVVLLDVNLAGTLSYKVAEVLRARGVPFIFTTGYGNASLPVDMRDAPVLSKPYMVSQLREALVEVCAGVAVAG
jgi:CheY-like chemotaxis protein